MVMQLFFILVVYMNPRVVYSYRNVHVVAVSKYQKFYDVRAYANKLNELNMLQRIERAKGILRSMNINISIKAIDNNVIYVNLSGKPIQLIVDAFGEAFKDVTITIVLFDSGLKRLHDLYRESGVWDIITSDPRENPIKQRLWDDLKRVYQDALRELKARLCYACDGAFGISGLRIVWSKPFAMPIPATIMITKSCDECADAVKHYVKVVADVLRKYIPEDIPLYIDL
jgi:hypothetical protein